MPNGSEKASVKDVLKSFVIMPESGSKEPYAPLNEQTDITVKANCFMAAITPKHGTLSVGDKGIEFKEDPGKGYIQIPYSQLVDVVCDVHGKSVRSVEITVSNLQKFPFVISHGADFVRALAKHVDRSQLIGNEGAFKRAFNRHKNQVKNLGKKFRKKDEDVEASE